MTAEEFKITLLPLKNKLFRLAIRLLDNRQEAEDIVQDVYLKIWKLKNDLGKYKSIEALMMTMTRNMCLDNLKRKSNKFSSLNENMHHSEQVDFSVKEEQKDKVEKVKLLIQNLPEQQKTIIHLRDVEGYDFEEIMKITSYDLNYIRVNLSRARKKIRETINNIH
jgi:RNA polymerase sigma factor (sigma-70 family)